MMLERGFTSFASFAILKLLSMDLVEVSVMIRRQIFKWWWCELNLQSAMDFDLVPWH